MATVFKPTVNTAMQPTDPVSPPPAETSTTSRQTTRQIFLATASGVFVALCLFAGLVFLVYGVWARASQQAFATTAIVELAKANLVRLRTELESYTRVHDELPPFDGWREALKADEQKSETDVAASKFYTLAEKRRFAKAPKLQFTDPWGTPYRLRYADVEFGTGSYDLTSFGPDKTEETDDDITEHGFVTPRRYP